MKEHERFQTLRKEKVKFSLRTRLTVFVGAVVLVSILISFGISKLLEWLVPSSTSIPLLIQLNLFSLVIALIATRFMSKMFFNLIKELRRGMEKIADGKFDTRIETSSSSKELQELFAGFNLMANELEATEILQTDFVSNVSHEFKTPINAIEGYAMLLQDGQRSEEQALYVKKILLNTRRLSELVGNVLLLSKVDHQAIDGNTSRFRLDEQIRSALLLLESKWTERETEFDVELESIEFTGNESMLLHVWSNLIDNAIKYGPRGGLITLHLREEAGQAVFTIEDCGPGIPESHQPHIFDKFYQVESSRTAEGNGLGLALTKRVLDVCGGTIAVENLPAAGCRFTVKLPLNG